MRPAGPPKVKKAGTGNPQVSGIPQGSMMAAGQVSPGMVRIQAKPASVLAAEAKKLQDQAAKAQAKPAKPAQSAKPAAEKKKAEPQTGEKRKAENKGNEQKKKKQPKNNEKQKSRTVVPDDFALNERKVYTGTVAVYRKFNGFGFITMDEKGFVPTDKVFVFWTGLNSTDRFPFLMAEQKVQFTLKKEKDKDEKTTLRAEAVCQIGGASIACQDEDDAKKDFVVSQAARFTGNLKFFNPKKMYGLIDLDEGQNCGGEEVAKELRVEFPEYNCAGGQPGYLVETQVEFGIVKNKKGQHRAHNLTGPSLTPLPTIEESPMPPTGEALPLPKPQPEKAQK